VPVQPLTGADTSLIVSTRNPLGHSDQDHVRRTLECRSFFDDTKSARLDCSHLVTKLCSSFYSLGWVSGTGGSICIRDGLRIFMAPSGVQKELMQPHNIFVLSPSGSIIRRGTRVAPGGSPVGPRFQADKLHPLKLSQCLPLFLSAFKLRGAGAVIHSHSPHAVLATMLWGEDETEFSCTHLEMMKGIKGTTYRDVLRVPIIENTAQECDLAAAMSEAIKRYPDSNAVLVRRHGVYIWGKDWVEAKTQAECYHYLFETAAQMHRLGVNPRLPPTRRADDEDIPMSSSSSSSSSSASLSTRVILLDIEGTTTPISFVRDVLFPYAREHVEEWTRSVLATQDDIRKSVIEELLVSVGQDLHAFGAVDPAAKATARVVHSLMDRDSKQTELKKLQGFIWKEGYESGNLKSLLFDDVFPCLKSWHRRGVRIAIYSSGSIAAQKLLFEYSDRGDVRHLLENYFDTTIGNKREVSSYSRILSELKCTNSPQSVCFVTDVLAEAVAARQAGMRAVISIRPGNADIKDEEVESFETIHSFVDLDVRR